LTDESLSLIEQCEREYDYLGYIKTVDPKMKPNLMFVTEIKKTKTYVRTKCYQFTTGATREFKTGMKVYRNVPYAEKDVVEVLKAETKNKTKRVGDAWVKSNEKELWVREIKFIRHG
jgi:DNA polymerase-3 subunit alpha